MADEQAPVETTTPVATPEPNTETPDDGAKDTAPETPETESKVDFQVAMHEERRKRQELESRLNDPDFIYEQAKRHGLTEAEATQAAQDTRQPAQAASPQSIDALVDQRLAIREDYNEALKLMPELKDDPDLMAWAAALVDSKKTHVEAVKIIQKRMGTVQKDAKLEGAVEAKTTISDKERAQTATQTHTVSSDAVELEQLQKAARNPYNKKAQEAAVVELMKRRNKAAGRG